MLLGNCAAQTASYELPPINYLDAKVQDPVAVLAERMAAGDVRLQHDATFGYLPSLLQALEVPTNSQTLVFSKTSLQLHRISPSRPRALYFNDDVYVGYCQRGDVLEIAATDPEQGAIFYTLSQAEDDEPRFVRDRGNCLACHANSRTQDVPGYVMRSVFPDRAGRPRLGSGTFTTDIRSEFQDRWGGWYVSGNHGSMRHMGNTIFEEDPPRIDREAGANAEDLEPFFRTDRYLEPTSDIVALMVLGHQTQMHNAIAAANYETRRAMHQSFEMNRLLDRPEGHLSDLALRRIDSAADKVVKQLLMCDEFTLSDPVAGSGGFAETFQARGQRDSRGRSLRDLDLETRLFKYPCSYLIHAPAFDALPDEVRNRILQRLVTILQGQGDSKDFDHLSPETRAAILEILVDTKPAIRQWVAAGKTSLR
ncbi:hypothetical protein FYK55_05910 [Roseiconus nitratireducens]|uniref:Cytochrome c domain-containing protein n=2 Tax=Roseiconus nitratireducens TaxID=2605748 RepID=A0A5M6DH34_9BACT|nr:hypothetical protein FYK55_05910 [Roseiconus nitratireducens]